MAQTYTLKVVEKINEAKDVVTLSFKQPALRKIKYKAGQYLTLLFRINGRRYIRPYSFSSSPGIDVNIAVTVKRVAGGIVSNHIYDKVQVGDMIEVMEPMGEFVVDQELITDETHLLLWGAGSGITPLFSIIKYVLHNAMCKVTLVYGNRNSESVIFSNAIEQLVTAYPDTFTVWHFTTISVVEEEHPTLIQGRIKPEKVLNVMRAEGNIANSLHYICGPAGLKESVKKALAALGIMAENIWTEDFELVKDEKELEEIVTRSVEISFFEQKYSIEVVKGQTILEAGLNASIELPYSCQTGNCAVCRGRVIGGTVKQVGITKANKNLAQDEYLLCCAYPLTDNVQIQVL